jgi:type I restriction enzyme S subunit
MPETPLRNGWAEASLDEIAWSVRPKYNPAEFPHLPFIGMEHVEPYTMRLLGTVSAAMMRSNAVHFQSGDVLYGRLRPYLNKVLVCEAEGLCSAEFIPLTTPPGVNPHFLAYALNSAAFVSFASHINEGDRPRVDYNDVGRYRIWVAPTPEQHRIVEAIESHLTRLDAAVAALEQVKANLRRYRGSVLKAAVEGRLVPTEAALARKEGRDYEPASALLARILEERRRRWEEAELAGLRAVGKIPTDDRWKAKYKEPLVPSLSNLPELPDGWCWASPDQLTTLITDGEHITPPRSSTGVLLLSAAFIRSSISAGSSYSSATAPTIS